MALNNNNQRACIHGPCIGLGSDTAQQILTQGIQPMLLQCWASVALIGPTLKQYWVNASCLLGRWEDCIIFLQICRNTMQSSHLPRKREVEHVSVSMQIQSCHYVFIIFSLCLPEKPDKQFRPQFFNFLFYGFFCTDWSVRGQNKNKVRSCVLFYFFIGSEEKKIIKLVLNIFSKGRI